MNPRDFLDVANDLVTGVREADWRSAVSRAYYSAFHVARDLLRHCGFVVPHADQAHSYLWLRLSNCGHLAIEEAGRRLGKLRTNRNGADYDLDHPFDEARAVGDLQLADNLFKLFDQVPGLSHVQQQITDAIRLSERDVLRQVTWQAPPSP